MKFETRSVEIRGKKYKFRELSVAQINALPDGDGMEAAEYLLKASSPEFAEAWAPLSDAPHRVVSEALEVVQELNALGRYAEGNLTGSTTGDS